MNEKEIIEAIMNEYQKYGVTRWEITLYYYLAIIFGVGKELVYPGIRFLLNDTFGIEDKLDIADIGQGFIDYAARKVKEENPTASDKDISTGISLVGLETIEESLKALDYTEFPALKGVKDYIIKNINKYVEENR